jgi:hypothetical protein
MVYFTAIIDCVEKLLTFRLNFQKLVLIARDGMHKPSYKNLKNILKVERTEEVTITLLL